MVLTVHLGAYSERVAVTAKADRLDWERRHNFFDDKLLMNIVENDLAVKPDCAHQKFIERTETNSFNIPRVLVEACCHLFGIDVVKIYGSMIRHRSKSLLHQV